MKLNKFENKKTDMEMKKFLLSVVALCATIVFAGAAELSISPSVQILTPAEAHHPVLSPDGATLLFSTENHEGLYSYDMATKNVTLLDEGVAAGFEPVFSADCKKVYYQTAEMVDGLLCRDVRSAEVKSGKVKKVKKASREDVNLQSIEGKTYSSTSASLKSILVTIDGKTTEIAPIEDAHSYLWPSLSPDRRKVLFNEPFKGVFICNIDGTGLEKVAERGDYPSWISDNAFVAVESKDDGYQVTTSVLKLYDFETGSSASLTHENLRVAELTTAPNTGDVVYSTVEGELYRTNIMIIR